MADSVRERVNPPIEELQRHRWKIFGVMMIGWAMSLIDISIVNIAIPEIQRDLETDTDTTTWVISAYNIVFAVLLVSMGRLADQFGRKRFFIIGMTVFTVGSALCALAWSIDWLIFFRVVQGAGAGILAPLGFAMTVLIFPPEQRGRGLALIAVVALVSTSIGPVLGAAILEVADWQWIFLANVPFGILGILLAIRVWPETYDLSAAGRRVDLVGMALLGLAVFSLTFALAEANSRGWDDALILFLLQGSVLLTGAFFLSQRYGKASMITPALMRNRQFTGANTAMVLFGAGAFGALFLLSLVFQNLWGYDQWEAALALLPVPLMGMVVWPFIAGGADTRAPRALAVPALLCMAAGLVWFSFVPSTSESWADYLIVLPGLLLIGVGIGAVFPSINVGAMGSVSGPELGLASGIVNTARQLGAAFGVALLVATVITASDYTLDSAREDIQDANDRAELPPALAEGVGLRKFSDYVGQSTRRFDPGPGFDELAAREAAGAARNAFGWGFRIAALLVLLAVPFARRMVRTPAAARAADAKAREAAATGAPPGAAA
ncbi:MAG: DHA2 family efflux MFS transporter permease subunit, partial [Thermoleophilaceae bacterium]